VNPQTAMATKYNLGAFSRRKLTTYGKTPRKAKVQSSSAVSSRISEDDDDILTAAPKTTPTERSPTSASPKLQDHPPSPASRPLPTAADRKRKFSQVQSSDGRAPQQDASPSSSSAESRPPTSVADSGRRVATASPDDVRVGIVDARLSSPPLTPTPPRVKPRHGPLTSKRLGPVSTKNPPRQIPVRVAQGSTNNTSSATLDSDTPKAKAVKSKQHGLSIDKSLKKPKKRLIDALVEQNADAGNVLDSETMDSPSESGQTLGSQASSTSVSEAHSLPTTPAPQATPARSRPRTFARTGSALKFTYGQGRKVLEEEDSFLDAFTLPEDSGPPLKGRRLELGAPKILSSPSRPFGDEDTMTSDSPRTKIRDIHELRQAGASTRVADEMQDLCDQIGRPSNPPSSSRRAALLRVAEKIQDRSFMRQCRDHGIDEAVLRDVGREADVISAYLILAILITIMTRSPSAHLIRLLQREETGVALARFLETRSDIKSLVRDRKNNLSKRSQVAMLAIETSLRQLPSWDKAAPSHVSLRTLSVKCLHLLITQEPQLGKDPTIFPTSVADALLEVLSEAVGEADPTDTTDSSFTNTPIDLYHALAVLDSHAVGTANTQRENGGWSKRYLSVIADVFGKTLDPQSEPDLESSILKLTINLTNNNLSAPEVFVSKSLVPGLAGSICNNFSDVLASASRDQWDDSRLDRLVLRLGILINFAEHSDAVRQVTFECQHNGIRPMDEFIQLFLNNYKRTAEADSVEKTHLNVVFGYLAVLLAYLCLHAPVRDRFRESHRTKSLDPLFESVREFVHHHRTMESQISEHDDSNPEQSGWEKLQALVNQLENDASYD
jgi:hypothetical protein